MTELKPPKPTKKGIIKTVIDAIPSAIKSYRKKQKKFKQDEKSFVKQEKDKVSKLQTQAKKTYEDLSPKQKKMFDRLGTSNPGMSTAKKIAIATGLTAGTAVGAGGIKFVGDVKEELAKNRMASGGMVKKRAKTRTKVSKGTGAAIRGKKFKGVF